VTGTGVEVYGVSPDSVKSHAKFRAKYDLPYHLLSDEGHRMADAYGVWVEKSMMGKTYMGIERTSFIIGPDGRVEHVLPRVKPAEHVDLLLEALAA
jgi:peroxiredoxin Q/BCP